MSDPSKRATPTGAAKTLAAVFVLLGALFLSAGLVKGSAQDVALGGSWLVVSAVWAWRSRGA